MGTPSRVAKRSATSASMRSLRWNWLLRQSIARNDHVRSKPRASPRSAEAMRQHLPGHLRIPGLWTPFEPRMTSATLQRCTPARSISSCSASCGRMLSFAVLFAMVYSQPRRALSVLEHVCTTQGCVYTSTREDAVGDADLVALSLTVVLPALVDISSVSCASPSQGFRSANRRVATRCSWLRYRRTGSTWCRRRSGDCTFGGGQGLPNVCLWMSCITARTYLYNIGLTTFELRTTNCLA